MQTQAASSVAGEPQAISLFGEPLYAREDTTGAIEAADRALAEDPTNVDLVIEAGRVRRNFWQYRQAIDLYGDAIGMAPDDWRPYRYRGHRYLSVREFALGVTDLERARGEGRAALADALRSLQEELAGLEQRLEPVEER